jgi:hypothetical protein
MTEKDIIFLVVGALIGFLVALFFYIRSSRDLKKEASDLRKHSTLILRGLENAGHIKLNRDEKGNIFNLDRIVGEVAVGIDAILVRESKSEEQNVKT